MKRIVAILRLPKEARNAALRSLFKATHIGYFGAVFAEGHGFYAMLGGAMLVFVVVDLFVHFAGE